MSSSRSAEPNPLRHALTRCRRRTFVLLASALLPPILLAVAVYWFGFRSAKRHDERERERVRGVL